MNGVAAAFVACLLAVGGDAAAATYAVGPGRPYASLQVLLAGVNLQPGDLVEVDGNATYAGGVILRDSGSAALPITIRGLRVNGLRPILSGAANTIEFRQSNHVVFEGFEVTGGTSRCVFVPAAFITLRDLLVRDCPQMGILSADQMSGSITLEYSEIRSSGSGEGRHALYLQSDEVAYPGAVLRMRHNYVHSGTGGNLLKSRFERAEIHYNWFEGAFYHELELIGPDPFEQQPGWSVDLKREDSEVLGNVIVHSGTFGAVMRFGGDGTGESRGRYRFVNNTVVVNGSAGNSVTVFRLFSGIESVEAHNNVIWRSSAGTFNIERTVEAEWVAGRRVAGSNNWISASSAVVPAEWTGTLGGTSPGFADAAAWDYRPAAGSPLLAAGNANPVSPPAWPFPSATLLPAFLPPIRQAIAPGTALSRPVQMPPTIGAVVERDAIFADGFGP
ncbi:MAG: hypothetical protein J0L88_02955 [Xanthomonadales bacterium]|nr:hypothetical protein [Xanthomonadales bacterium]